MIFLNMDTYWNILKNLSSGYEVRANIPASKSLHKQTSFVNIGTSIKINFALNLVNTLQV